MNLFHLNVSHEEIYSRIYSILYSIDILYSSIILTGEAQCHRKHRSFSAFFPLTSVMSYRMTSASSKHAKAVSNDHIKMTVRFFEYYGFFNIFFLKMRIRFRCQ